MRSGAIVLSSNSDCQDCEVIRKSGVYLLYPEYRGFRRVSTRRSPKLFYRLELDRIVVFWVLHVHRDHPSLLSSES